MPSVTPFGPFGPACQPTGFCEAEVCSAWVVQVTCRLWWHAVVATLGTNRGITRLGSWSRCQVYLLAGVAPSCQFAFIQLFLQLLQGRREQGRQGLAWSSRSLAR